MPELPEVETVRAGLAPVMEGARIASVTLNRPDLRFPFPEKFISRLEGQRMIRLTRRAKYLVGELENGEHLIMHLGMTGRFSIEGKGAPGNYHHDVAGDRHVHVIFELEGPNGPANITYADPRRFGFMDLVPAGELASSAHFARMGPEPLSDELTADTLRLRLAGKSAPLKAALLDQRVVAGLGNIYVCEALYRAGLSPRRMARTVGPARAEKLVRAIKDVLQEAVEAGGSTLRDFAATDGAMGYFQHRFDVYDRAGEACRKCASPIQRLVQSGRSTFFCGTCQR